MLTATTQPAFVYDCASQHVSLRVRAIARNNPLANIDPTGLDCVTDNGDGTATINSGDCPGNDPNNEYYYDCGATDGCLTGTTSANLTADGSLGLYNGSSNTYYSVPGYGGEAYQDAQSSTQNSGSSWWPNFTFEFGLGGNIGIFGPVTGTLAAGIILDSHGHFGSYSTGGAGLSAGAGASAGIQIGSSNGNGICAFGGPFYNGATTAGAGPGGTIDGFAGKDSSGKAVLGGSVTLGAGAGASSSGTVTVTKVIPFGGGKC